MLDFPQINFSKDVHARMFSRIRTQEIGLGHEFGLTYRKS